MQQGIKKQQTQFFYDDHLVSAQYCFIPCTDVCKEKGRTNVWLDISFAATGQEEPVQLRLAKSGLILFQPEEVIEAIVHREIRDFFRYQPAQRNALAPSYLLPAIC